MIILQAGLLGMLQAVTEIFPLSNTAHIILLQNLIGYRKSFPAYDVMVDCGVLTAFFVYFGKDMIQMAKEMPVLIQWPFRKDKDSLFLEYPYALMLIYIILSTFVTAFVRFVFEDARDFVGNTQFLLGAVWMAMGFLLLRTKRYENGVRTIYEMNHQDAFVIGLAQGMAVFPGVSRIGIALLAAMFLGIQKKEAARYTFLLAVPYLISAIAYKFYEGPHFFDSDQTALLVAFIAAAAFGVFVLALFMKILKKGFLFLTGFYCLALGAFAIVHSLMKMSFLK